MNKEQRQSNGYSNSSAFSSSGLFTVSYAVSGRSGCVFGRTGLPGLMDAVALPRFGLEIQFKSYPVPYDWLNDGKIPDADEDHAEDGRNVAISHFNQHNSIQVFGSSPLYRLLINKSIWNVSRAAAGSNDSRRMSGAPSDRDNAENVKPSILYSESRNGINGSKRSDTVKTDVPTKQTSSADLMTRLVGRIVSDPEKQAAEKMDATGVDVLFRSVNSNGLKKCAHLVRKLRGKCASAASTYTNPIASKVPDADAGQARSATPGNREDLNLVLQQESIQRTIEALATKSAEDQRDHKAEFRLLRHQMEEAEQLSNQDMRHLQRSVQELKNLFRDRRQPVSFSPPRPPSLYGWLK